MALKDESTADSVWFRGVKNNMTRMIALRKAANCESFDHSAEEIYLEHIKAICAAFAQADTAEAASRKLAVKTCWRARAPAPSASTARCSPWAGRPRAAFDFTRPQEFLSPRSPWGERFRPGTFPRVFLASPIALLSFGFGSQAAPGIPPGIVKGGEYAFTVLGHSRRELEVCLARLVF